MGNLSRTIIASTFLLASAAFSCDKDEGIQVDSFLQSLDSTAYYEQELLTEKYRYIYGIWNLFEVSGGIHGSGYDPDFNCMEIKPYGIYGLARRDSIFEFGKIELLPQPLNMPGWITIKFNAEQYAGASPYHSTPFHIRMSDVPTDTLDMNTAFPDGYSYHFRRMK